MSNHRTERLRVAVPTLEPDPVFLGVLAELGASSQPVAPQTARSAGLRMIVATASVAVIAAATWAAGTPTGSDIPLSPADSPTQEEPSGPPSHGNVGTPQPDVSTSPGSPLSPGLPGTHSSASDRADGSERAIDRARIPAERPGERKDKDKGRKVGHDKGRKPDLPGLPEAPDDGPAAKLGDPAALGTGSAPKDDKDKGGADDRRGTDGDRPGPGRGHGRGHGPTK